MMNKAMEDIFHFPLNGYQSKKDCISDEHLKKLYSLFRFCWFHSNNCEDNEEKKAFIGFFSKTIILLLTI